MAKELLPIGGETAGARRASERAAPAGPPHAARLLALQRAAGNRAVGGIVHRQLTIHGANVTDHQITTPGQFRTGLDQVIANETAGTGYTAADVRGRLVKLAQRGAHAYRGRRMAVRAAIKRLQNSEWRRLTRRDDVVYRAPPLTEAAARAIFDGIERDDPNALQGLQRAGGAYNPRQTATEREHEWGILKAKGHRDECLLVIGDRTGVTWGPFLRCGVGIAHSHPYFETGQTRHKRHQTILLNTKEIADHPNLPAGIVAWNALSANVGEGATEVSKIFPSASDIVFSGQHHLPAHSVYTPYAVLDRNGAKYVANPELNAGAFRQAPRLVFVIRNAVLAADHVNYRCTLDATANGGPAFWTRTVTTAGIGQFGGLNW